MQLELSAAVHSPVSEVVSEIEVKPEYADGWRGLDSFPHALTVFFMHP